MLFHACAHNPTGFDPNPEQWAKLAEVCHANKLFPLFDTAYQGFAGGDLEKDAYGIRYFHNAGFEYIVCQSFAKIMGLYGERVGGMHVVCKDAEYAKAVLSQIKLSIRSNYSNPPKHGARIATMLMNDPTYRKVWLDELTKVADDIIDRRVQFRKLLEHYKTPGDWSVITDQIGMFSYTGISKEQCIALQDKHHIYMPRNGRVSISMLNEGNYDYVAKAFKDVCENN